MMAVVRITLVSLSICLVLLGGLSEAKAATFYVGVHGDDHDPGTKERPLGTFAGARDAVRRSGKLGHEPIDIVFSGGTYYLPETLAFTDVDSGAAAAPVVYRPEGAEVIISGGQRLDLAWTPGDHGLFAAKVPAGLTIDQLFVNGALQRMARYPNYDPAIAVFNGYAADAFAPERVSRWAHPEGGYIHVMHRALWGGFHYRITGKNPDGSLAYEGGWQNNRTAAMHPQYRFVENIREELDAPGEWFHDRATNTLYFIPPPTIDLAKAIIEVVRLRSLVEFRGTRAQPVRFLTLSGFTFRHAARTFMDAREPLLRSDWCIYRGGAVTLTGAEDCTISDCVFDQLGGNAVCVSNYNHHVTIAKSWIRDCGASGVAFVGNPSAVRSALFNYAQRTTYAEVDRTPGPKSDDYPLECTVDDCLITRTGRVEKQSAGVEISMSRRITIRNCSIYDVPRAGINIGDGTWGGHVIDGCDVFDTVLETGDHGSFNAWGRDRYWQLRDAPAGELRQLALLDAIEPTDIRNSRWRCDHGWDIDLDDGATNYQIHHNVLLSGGLKLREGFRRDAWNNVIVNNSLHAHVWYANSGDSFTKNIVMGRYRPARMPVGQWGDKVDQNVFTTDDADRTAFLGNGCDEHSVVGEPAFIAPAKGDFRLNDWSPARALEITDVPQTFGVRDPKLRAHARSPVIPPLRKLARAGTGPTAHWLGAEIRNVEGEEYSAFGLARDAGGVVILDAPGHSSAVRSGLHTGDVVTALGDQRIKTVDDLVRLISVAKPPIELGIRRDQTDQVIRLTTAVSAPTR